MPIRRREKTGCQHEQPKVGSMTSLAGAVSGIIGAVQSMGRRGATANAAAERERRRAEVQEIEMLVRRLGDPPDAA